MQIATRLNVLPSTVSRALRPETAHLVRVARRKAILELAEKLHLSPNSGVRMVRKGVNASLTIVVPMDENIFFSEFFGRFLSGTLPAAVSAGKRLRPPGRCNGGIRLSAKVVSEKFAT